jgi:hypothetical protein
VRTFFPFAAHILTLISLVAAIVAELVKVLAWWRYAVAELVKIHA